MLAAVVSSCWPNPSNQQQAITARTGPDIRHPRRRCGRLKREDEYVSVATASTNTAHQDIADVAYVDTFFRELSPAWLNYVARLHGIVPRGLDASFTYLELGCGFGTSAIVHAGAFPDAQFHACDFNAGHIDAARRHAAAMGIHNIQFYEVAFADVLALQLPDFDFIAAHGVYSWVSADTRQQVRKILATKANRGALIYLSYNCLPGWCSEAPLRKLMLEMARSFGGNTRAQAEQSLSAVQRLSNASFEFFSAHPSASNALEIYGHSPGNYLAHEFFSEACDAFYSIDVADDMAANCMRYLGSATLADNHAELLMPAVAAAAVSSLPTQRQFASRAV